MSRSYSEFVTPLLRSLRAEIMVGFGKVDHEIKDDLSAVTEIDKNIESKLVDKLSARFPEIGFHGEEHGRQGNEETYWLIDPIDGTENYIRGLPGVTTILGLVENGEVTQSYIYDPVDDVVYSAFKGMGAYADDERIYVSQRKLDRTQIIISPAILTDCPDFYAKVNDTGVAYVGLVWGSGIKAVYMASGKIDGVVTHTIRRGGPWDFAPTSFLAKEAGAIVTYFDEPGVDSRSHAVLSPSINDTLLPIIREELRR